MDAEQYGTFSDYVMRIGEAAKAVSRNGNAVDLVEQLRHLLEEQGIQGVEPGH